MTADFLEYFSTEKFDDKIILNNSVRNYSLKNIKQIISRKIKQLRKISSENIVLNSDDNLVFILNFLACIFAKKEIFLLNDIKKINQLKDGYFLFEDNSLEPDDIIKFVSINPNNIFINFFTSGSSGKSKCIKKSLQNLINESHDLNYKFKFSKNLEFISTTTLNHLFGVTFHLMLPLNTGNIINTDSVYYPENIKICNACLVTSPSFLEKMEKYNVKLETLPEYIISAGAKLNNSTFDYANSISKLVIDIYGSTETGVIASRMASNEKRKIFNGIKILETGEDFTKIASEYSYNDFDILGDKIKQNGEFLELLGRCDRILKIQEKRISATELENEINKSKFVNQSYCFEFSKKIAILVSLTADGFDFAVKNGLLELKKKWKSNIKDKFEIIPQRWKFIDELPKNINGKINKDEINKIFSLNLSLPLVLARRSENNYAELKLFFYKNCNFFQGHFEGFPIVAGVVQLFFANYFIQKEFGLDCHCGQIRKIKFANIIHADTILDLRLIKSEKGISFEYKSNEKIYSSGLLPCENMLKS